MSWVRKYTNLAVPYDFQHFYDKVIEQFIGSTCIVCCRKYCDHGLFQIHDTWFAKCPPPEGAD